MNQKAAIAVVGTFDSKGEEHLFIKTCIEKRGYRTLTIHVGTRGASPFPADIDLYPNIISELEGNPDDRDQAIQTALILGKRKVKALYEEGNICGIISAGGGTGTHIGTGIMRAIPLGIPKVMVSTVASRDMSDIVGTKDITMMHSVVDILGLNSISINILEKAAAAVCAMADPCVTPQEKKKSVALTFFGFITPAAENVKIRLEHLGYEVIPFHANGTGGMAMEELAEEGYFQGILDLATHELADDLLGGYCGGIGPGRLQPPSYGPIPRLVVPGGLDCAVLEFTRKNVPDQFKDRKIFFYDFRSAIRLNRSETQTMAHLLAEKLNKDVRKIKILIPQGGWSEADREDGPLYDPLMRDLFVRVLKTKLDPRIKILESNGHINDPSFADLLATTMHDMIEG